MKRTTRLVIGMLTLGLIFVGAKSALADDCAAFGGTINAGECQVNGPATVNGTKALDETLHIFNGGQITVASPGLTINIKGGLIMEAGSLIDGGNRTCGGPNTTAFPITINTDGDIDVDGPDGLTPGAIIRANG